jgi:hypothetical protein
MRLKGEGLFPNLDLLLLAAGSELKLAEVLQIGHQLASGFADAGDLTAAGDFCQHQ